MDDCISFLEKHLSGTGSVISFAIRPYNMRSCVEMLRSLQLFSVNCVIHYLVFAMTTQEGHSGKKSLDLQMQRNQLQFQQTAI